jgi:hypothetical protein
VPHALKIKGQADHSKIYLLFAKYNWNDQLEDDEMDRAGNTNVEEEECIQDIGGEARKKETTRKTKT